MSNANCPCKGCVPPKRCPGCHGSCAEYIAWQRNHVRHLMAVRRAKEKQKVCSDYTAERVRKNKKKREDVEKLRK